MLVYDFFNFSDKKFGEKDWTKSNETLDLLGVNSEVYTAKGLWTIKSRGFGIKAKLTDLSENQDNDRLIFEYVIRDKKENWGDFTHGIFEKGSEIFEGFIPKILGYVFILTFYDFHIYEPYAQTTIHAKLLQLCLLGKNSKSKFIV